jgi:hypothetical protein
MHIMIHIHLVYYTYVYPPTMKECILVAVQLGINTLAIINIRSIRVEI